MNKFGNNDGFKHLMDALALNASEDRMVGANAPSLKGVSYLAIMVSMPLALFHFDFVLQFGGDYTTYLQRHLLNSRSDLKSLDPDDIDQIQSSILAVFYSIKDTAEIAHRETQLMKL